MPLVKLYHFPTIQGICQTGIQQTCHEAGTGGGRSADSPVSLHSQRGGTGRGHSDTSFSGYSKSGRSDGKPWNLLRNTPEEARERIIRKTMEATRQDYCLLEEFIVGEIFGVESMIEDGKILYMLPNNIEAFISTTPTPVGHSVPYKYIDTLGTQIFQQTEKAIRALGLDNCPVNCDFIRRDDKVYVIELTGRSGATGLSEMVSIYF